ncbi:hypothetical protein J2Z31_004625 [Sinorhizobium kostiense]|uniref:Uncharacterized protein n=1 Tax=Sinorhizobium kostiense TaxID=76747 RepID=A0ABS4R5E6_9HYPH|nr:major capsid family protein [Sinorhizobium kostiense]MBP2238098.1 hypothetical protein [Sinorhizobium kostiense]
MNAIITQDAQQVAMSFLIRQASLIEPTVYAMKYQEIQYAQLIPVDTSAPEWIQSVTYFSMDSVGQAQWFSGLAHDVPKVELTREKFETTVSMAAIGYGYTLELTTARGTTRVKKIGAKGQGRAMHWSKVMDLVDEIRVAEGQEPLKRRAA